MSPAQSLRTKRAEVEFHASTALGEPEAALADYEEKNRRRAAFLAQHAGRIGPLTPFLEIGAHAGHSSYMLVNRFSADGFALDLSVDALRHGRSLMEKWGLHRAPVRIGGDAARLPFREGSLRFVVSYQSLGEFQSVETIFREVRRVLAPGGVFLFAEEPVRRLLTLRLFRSPHVKQMRPWQRILYEAGVLGYLADDVIGSRQEEVQGIQLFHGVGVNDWRRAAHGHFQEVELFFDPPDRGWGEHWVKRAALACARGRPEFAAELLGGTVNGICRKEGPARDSPFAPERFEEVLQCPDCGAELARQAKPEGAEANRDLRCTACPYSASLQDGVYNLLPSKEREELYPSDSEDLADFSRPGHEARLLEGWFDLEGVYGNRYRWIGAEAALRLKPVRPEKRRLRVRGYAAPDSFRQGLKVTVSFDANDQAVGESVLRESGPFVFEADLPRAPEYVVRIRARPTFVVPGVDERPHGVTISLIRLVEAD